MSCDGGCPAAADSLFSIAQSTNHDESGPAIFMADLK